MREVIALLLLLSVQCSLPIFVKPVYLNENDGQIVSMKTRWPRRTTILFPKKLPSFKLWWHCEIDVPKRSIVIRKINDFRDRYFQLLFYSHKRPTIDQLRNMYDSFKEAMSVFVISRLLDVRSVIKFIVPRLYVWREFALTEKHDMVIEPPYWSNLYECMKYHVEVLDGLRYFLEGKKKEMIRVILKNFEATGLTYIIQFHYATHEYDPIIAHRIRICFRKPYLIDGFNMRMTHSTLTVMIKRDGLLYRIGNVSLNSDGNFRHFATEVRFLLQQRGRSPKKKFYPRKSPIDTGVIIPENLSNFLPLQLPPELLRLIFSYVTDAWKMLFVCKGLAFLTNIVPSTDKGYVRHLIRFVPVSRLCLAKFARTALIRISNMNPNLVEHHATMLGQFIRIRSQGREKKVYNAIGRFTLFCMWPRHLQSETYNPTMYGLALCVLFKFQNLKLAPEVLDLSE